MIRVLLTGGTGYVASWLIMRLLQHGYKVRTTKRSCPDTKKDISFLTNLPGATKNLQIFSADLDHPVSFGPAIEGCTGVFHVGQSIDFDDKEPDQVKHMRAINGAIEILKACLTSKTVKRVVYSSSASAVGYNKGSSVVDENMWSDTEFIKSLMPVGASYYIGKTLTEKAVLEFGEKHGLNIMSVIPGYVNGPFICPRVPGSVSISLAMIMDSNKDLSYLTNLPYASEKLQIFDADLAQPESFNPVIQGCTGVFHVAHPIDFEDREPEQVKTQRSINGILGILKACLDSKTVRRVVYTSSASTVVFNEKGEEFLDESDWSDVDYIRSLKPFGASYMISKTLTEKAALEFAEKHGLDLVTVVPTFINGPFICPRLPGSVYTSMAMIFGDKDQYQHLTKIQMVHVDDVARAHIFLLEYPEAKGRYICTSVDMTMDEMSEFLLARYPEYPIPTPDSLKEIERVTYSGLSSKKLLETGFRYSYGMEDIYDEAIKCCKEKGFL